MVKCRPPDDPGGDVSANSGGGKCVRKVEVTIWPPAASISLVLLPPFRADFLGARLTVVTIEGGGGAGGVAELCMSGSDLRVVGGVIEPTAIECCIKQLESDGRRSTYWDMLVISSRLARPLGGGG